MSKHTQGPWIVVEGGPLEGDTVITTQSRIAGDIVPIVDMDTEWEGEIGIEQQANAKLIAAAPQLLEALAETLIYLPEHPEDRSLREAVCRARAAIAKATA